MHEVEQEPVAQRFISRKNALSYAERLEAEGHRFLLWNEECSEYDDDGEFMVLEWIVQDLGLPAHPTKEPQ